MNLDIQLPSISVLHSTMAYREAGRPDAPIALFLHGNPTSSYIWRNILPVVSEIAHCLAPDLIGFGQSGKPDIPYRFEDHVRFLDAFLEAKGIDSAYIAAQDWGTALAFHLAARRPEFVRGLAFMEFTRPVSTWKEFLNNSTEREIFQKFRTPGEGEKLIFDDNLFVERILPGATVRTLSDEEMAVYRAPFLTRESRRPTWRFPNELPIAGEPPDVYAMMEKAHEALAAAIYPKLLFAGDPGALVPTTVAEEFSRKLPNCKLVRLGSGKHYLQEDHPDVIAREVYKFIVEIEGSAVRQSRME
jgi:haloalkane dehalogenase